MRKWVWKLPRKGLGMSSPEHVMDADGVSRREFLCVGGLGVVGLSLGEVGAALRPAMLQKRRVIFVMMAGGPSHLDTFDPKPEAPLHYRGPMRAVQTRVPGVWLADSLPLLAERAHRWALIRSLHHDAAPIHETGQQLLQCGRLVQQGVQFPHFGAVVAHTRAAAFGAPTASRAPANVVLPRALRATGTHPENGQSGGVWGSTWNPIEVPLSAATQEPEALRRYYGDTHFGRLLLQARQLVEQGTQTVTVNLFDSLHQRVTWDCHGDVHCAPGTIFDYRDVLCPQFDRALAGLIDDLHDRGLLNDTLIVATGEFGRTPRINDHSGRDHWPACWSAMVAGGGVTGGAVIGASDALGEAPIDRPVAPSELTATLLAWCGIDGQKLEVEVGEKTLPMVPDQPLVELWS